MTFWLIVLGIIAFVLLLAWRHDRRRKGGVRGDIWKRTDQATGMNVGKGEAAGKSPVPGMKDLPFGF